MNEEEILFDKSRVLPAVQNSGSDISESANLSTPSDIEEGALQVGTIMVSCPIVDLEKKAPLLTLEDWTDLKERFGNWWQS
jgi:hypothetical protein